MTAGSSPKADRRVFPGGALTEFPLVAVTGPTAVGKTSLSLRLADELRGEIINCDSIQVYRGLDIGSAKPVREERERVPHHLLDVLGLDEPFDAAVFVRRAGAIIRTLRSRGRVPLLIGGTGLYLRSLLQGLVSCPGADPALRAQLRRMEAECGAACLHGFLRQVDPEAADRLHPNDTFRVIRAIEVFSSTGLPISCWQRRRLGVGPGLGRCVKIGLIRPREELYRRINRRVDLMIENGLIDEVRGLIEKGFSPRLKPLQSIGYRHIIGFLCGDLSLDEAVAQLKRDTRRYAKRQITWLRADHEIRWFDPADLTGRERVWPRVAGAGGDR